MSGSNSVVEFLLPKQAVAGSNPVSRSNMHRIADSREIERTRENEMVDNQDKIQLMKELAAVEEELRPVEESLVGRAKPA